MLGNLGCEAGRRNRRRLQPERQSVPGMDRHVTPANAPVRGLLDLPFPDEAPELTFAVPTPVSRFGQRERGVPPGLELDTRPSDGLSERLGGLHGAERL